MRPSTGPRMDDATGVNLAWLSRIGQKYQKLYMW
jgi:hypothetical protein